MLQWPVRIASVVALTVLAYGWGDWLSSERPAVDGVLLAVLTIVLCFALARLYRPGGLAAFEPETARAPGEAVVETAPAAVVAPRRETRRERAAKRAREKREAAPPPTAPFAEPVREREREPEPPARQREPEPQPARGRGRGREREPSAPLWSGERRGREPEREPAGTPARAGALDLNAATVDELAMLPGIGRGAAARVVEHRSVHGPFRSVGELERVEGFDPGRVGRVARRLRV